MILFTGYPENVILFEKKQHIDPINYCNENKDIVEERHSNAHHLSVTNPTSICERLEPFVRTINKHLAFNGNR